ncbi:MAG: hypothetical protein AB7T49_13035 [Oligoflexales bacterium]
MFDSYGETWKLILSAIFFPTMFQGRFLEFAWGAEDDFLVATGKRLFLLLPTFCLIFACWVTILCILSLIIRHQRRQYFAALLVSWWDLFRAIFNFWGGVFKFLTCLASWLLGFLRIVVLFVVVFLKDLVMTPVRLIGDFGHVYFTPGIPWAAVGMMVFWTLLESLIFTYVMTPLVTDVMSSIAGEPLSGPTLQIPLYLFFSMIIMGSYAVLLAFGQAIKDRDIPKIISYSIIEVVVAMTEVVFLYREFVDALMPWFAQHAGEGFEIGIFGMLSIATFAWLGIRSMTWFLFGKTAVPTLMAIIERSNIEGKKEFFSTKNSDAEKSKMRRIFVYITESIDKIKGDWIWVEERSEKLLSAFIVPPLQMVAAIINFCTFLISRSHIFELPFTSYKDILDARALLANAKKTLTDQF